MEGTLLTGDESGVEFVDDSGIRFDIQAALSANEIVKVSKTSFTCFGYGRKNSFDTNDLKIALAENFNRVALFQRVGKASKKLSDYTRKPNIMSVIANFDIPYKIKVNLILKRFR